MNAQENKQLVIEGYQLFQSGDIRNLLERYHDDAEWIAPESESVPFAGNYHGKQEIAQFFAKLDASAQVTRFTPKEFFAEGDKVVVLGEAAWLAKPTGRSFEHPWVHVLTMRDGKIARFESIFDTAPGEKAFQSGQPGQASATTQLHH